MLPETENQDYLVVNKAKLDEFVQSNDLNSSQTQDLISYIEHNNLRSQFQDMVWGLIKERLWKKLGAFGITSAAALILTAWSLYNSAEQSAVSKAQRIADTATIEIIKKAENAVDNRIGDQIALVRKTSFETLQENMNGKARLDQIMQGVEDVHRNLRAIDKDQSISNMSQLIHSLEELGGARTVAAVFKNSVNIQSEIQALHNKHDTLQSKLIAASEILSIGIHGCSVQKLVGPSGWETACEKEIRFETPVHSSYEVTPSLIALDFPKGNRSPIYQIRVEDKAPSGFKIVLKSAYQILNHATFSWVAVKVP